MKTRTFERVRRRSLGWGNGGGEGFGPPGWQTRDCAGPDIGVKYARKGKTDTYGGDEGAGAKEEIRVKMTGDSPGSRARGLPQGPPPYPGLASAFEAFDVNMSLSIRLRVAPRRAAFQK